MTETTAAQRGWGPGWPSCQSSKMTSIHPVGRAITCRAEAAVAMDYLIRRFDAEVEDINSVPDDGAFACRPIRGSQPPVASNHSWGLAIDLNWGKHPLGERGTFTAGQVLRIHLIVAEMRLVRWGGDYEHRADEMHFEFLGTPTDMAHLTRRIKALNPQKWPAFDGRNLKLGSTGSRVTMLQRRLGSHVTGTFDPYTEREVRWHQTTRHHPVTGTVRAADWNSIGWKLK